MNNHTPKAPDDFYWPAIKRLVIDIDAGKVYNREGRELKCKPQKTRQYVFIGVVDRAYKRAHLVWWKATGEWPKFMLDHRNRDKLDDRYTNLEYTNSSRNALNVGPPEGIFHMDSRTERV